MAWFTIDPERYMPAAHPDKKGSYQFQLPRICAVCGTAATHHRDVKIDTTDFGVVGSVAKAYVKAERAGGGMQKVGKYDDSPSEQVIGFTGMRIPVCARHTFDASFEDAAVVLEGRTLRIQNYGFYKEFLSLNHIDGPVERISSGSPST